LYLFKGPSYPFVIPNSTDVRCTKDKTVVNVLKDRSSLSASSQLKKLKVRLGQYIFLVWCTKNTADCAIYYIV